MDTCPPCRLCGGQNTAVPFHVDKIRRYLKCEGCQAIFVPDECIVSEADEKAEYDLHDNFAESDGYRQFLSRAAAPVAAHLAVRTSAASESIAKYRGLDFGCGPNPLLAKMLSAESHNCEVDIYDKYYFSQNESLLLVGRSVYDFITLTEVFEHLRSPLSETERLWGLLKPGGILVVMTKRAEGTVEAFRRWHYIRDKTHILFMSEAAFAWLANHLSSMSSYPCTLRLEGKDIAILCKSSEPLHTGERKAVTV